MISQSINIVFEQHGWESDNVKVLGAFKHHDDAVAVCYVALLELCEEEGLLFEDLHKYGMGVWVDTVDFFF